MKEIKEQISGNLRTYYRSLAAHCEMIHVERGGVEVFWNRNEPWPALMVGVPDQDSVKDLVADMAAGELPNILVVDTEDPDKLSFLESAGLRPFRKWRGMHLDPAEFVRAPLPGELVWEINRPGDLEDYRSIINKNMLGAFPMGSDITGAMAASDKLHWLVGRVEGRAVTAAVVCVDGHVAGLYVGATEADCRKRGYGASLITNMVDLALAEGVDSVVLHSSAMGEGIYSRIGFRYVEDYTLMISL